MIIIALLVLKKMYLGNAYQSIIVKITHSDTLKILKHGVTEEYNLIKNKKQISLYPLPLKLKAL